MAGYGATGSKDGAPFQQVMDGLKKSVTYKRKLNAVDLFGIEGKNTYELYNGTDLEEGGSQLVMRTGEKSGFVERCCLVGGREAKWTSRYQNKTGQALFVLDKQRHWPCCACCSRPHAKVNDIEGRVIGSIDDPCTFCSYNHDLFDAHGKQLYHLEGTCCQIGLFCPICADAVMQIQEGEKGGPEVGRISRLQFSLLECCCPTMRYRVDFPQNATANQKALLLSSALMIDSVYFEVQQEQGGG